MKKLLVIVDYQKDFVCGSLGFEGAEALETAIAEKIHEYRQLGGEIVYTLDTHGENYLETSEGKSLPVAHCVKNSEGWQLYESMGELLKGCQAFEKNTFGSALLFDYLRKQDFAEIELCGLVSSICVLSNAVLAKTAQPEAKIIVDARATGARDKEMNQKALDVLENIQVQVLNR